MIYLGTFYWAMLVEVYINVFSKPTGIVIPDCSGITKCYNNKKQKL